MKIFLIFVLVLAAVWVNSASPVDNKEREVAARSDEITTDVKRSPVHRASPVDDKKRTVAAREVRITEDVKRSAVVRNGEGWNKRGTEETELKSRMTRSWWNPFTWFGSGDSKVEEAPTARAAGPK